MRSICLFLAVLFAIVATSYAMPESSFPTLEARKNGNNTKSDDPQRSVQKTCGKIRRLEWLTGLGANQTQLDEWIKKGKLTTAKADKIKAKAADATTELKTLKSNATLVSECAVVAADRKINRQCRQIKKLTKLAALAGNETAMAEFEARRGIKNETIIAKLKEYITGASTKLKELQTNTTLTDYCKHKQQKKNANDLASNSGSTMPAAATAGADQLSLQTLPYILVPALAAIFALFL